MSSTRIVYRVYERRQPSTPTRRMDSGAGVSPSSSDEDEVVNRETDTVDEIDIEDQQNSILKWTEYRQTEIDEFSDDPVNVVYAEPLKLKLTRNDSYTEVCGLLTHVISDWDASIDPNDIAYWHNEEKIRQYVRTLNIESALYIRFWKPNRLYYKTKKDSTTKKSKLIRLDVSWQTLAEFDEMMAVAPDTSEPMDMEELTEFYAARILVKKELEKITELTGYYRGRLHHPVRQWLKDYFLHINNLATSERMGYSQTTKIYLPLLISTKKIKKSASAGVISDVSHDSVTVDQSEESQESQDSQTQVDFEVTLNEEQGICEARILVPRVGTKLSKKLRYKRKIFCNALKYKINEELKQWNYQGKVKLVFEDFQREEFEVIAEHEIGRQASPEQSLENDWMWVDAPEFLTENYPIAALSQGGSSSAIHEPIAKSLICDQELAFITDGYIKPEFFRRNEIFQDITGFFASFGERLMSNRQGGIGKIIQAIQEKSVAHKIFIGALTLIGFGIFVGIGIATGGLATLSSGLAVMVGALSTGLAVGAVALTVSNYIEESENSAIETIRKQPGLTDLDFHSAHVNMRDDLRKIESQFRYNTKRPPCEKHVGEDLSCEQEEKVSVEEADKLDRLIQSLMQGHPDLSTGINQEVIVDIVKDIRRKISQDYIRGIQRTSRSDRIKAYKGIAKALKDGDTHYVLKFYQDERDALLHRREALLYKRNNMLKKSGMTNISHYYHFFLKVYDHYFHDLKQTGLPKVIPPVDIIYIPITKENEQNAIAFVLDHDFDTMVGTYQRMNLTAKLSNEQVNRLRQSHAIAKKVWQKDVEIRQLKQEEEDLKNHPTLGTLIQISDMIFDEHRPLYKINKKFADEPEIILLQNRELSEIYLNTNDIVRHLESSIDNVIRSSMRTAVVHANPTLDIVREKEKLKRLIDLTMRKGKSATEENLAILQNKLYTLKHIVFQLRELQKRVDDYHHTLPIETPERVEEAGSADRFETESTASDDSFQSCNPYTGSTHLLFAAKHAELSMITSSAIHRYRDSP